MSAKASTPNTTPRTRRTRPGVPRRIRRDHSSARSSSRSRPDQRSAVAVKKGAEPKRAVGRLLRLETSGKRQVCRGPSIGARCSTAKIISFHEASDRVYGAPRIQADLRDDGETVSRKTVAKLMRSNGIVGISPRGFAPVTTVPGPAGAVLPDLVERWFDRGELDRVWTSDITYLDTGQGWLYLCAVRDGCSRRVLGWSIQDHLRADLVDAALTMAVVLRGSCRSGWSGGLFAGVDGPGGSTRPLGLRQRHLHHSRADGCPRIDPQTPPRHPPPKASEETNHHSAKLSSEG